MIQTDSQSVRQMISHYKRDEVLWHLQPLEYISNIVDFYQEMITNKTKVVVVDMCDSSIFIHQMKVLSKYMYLLGWNFDIILIVKV
jgi:hypothetical protein